LQEPTLSRINIWYLPYFFLKIHFKIVYHLCLGLPTGFLPLCFRVKTLYKFIFFPILATPHPFHPSCLYYPDNIWQGVQVLEHIIMQFTHTLVDPSHLHPHILPRTIFGKLWVCVQVGIKQSLYRPWGFQDVEAPRF
jgi:hypothetical protein